MKLYFEIGFQIFKLTLTFALTLCKCFENSYVLQFKFEFKCLSAQSSSKYSDVLSNIFSHKPTERMRESKERTINWQFNELPFSLFRPLYFFFVFYLLLHTNTWHVYSRLTTTNRLLLSTKALTQRLSVSSTACTIQSMATTFVGWVVYSFRSYTHNIIDSDCTTHKIGSFNSLNLNSSKFY